MTTHSHADQTFLGDYSSASFDPSTRMLLLLVAIDIIKFIVVVILGMNL